VVKNHILILSQVHYSANSLKDVNLIMCYIYSYFIMIILFWSFRTKNK